MIEIVTLGVAVGAEGEKFGGLEFLRDQSRVVVVNLLVDIMDIVVFGAIVVVLDDSFSTIGTVDTFGTSVDSSVTVADTIGTVVAMETVETLDTIGTVVAFELSLKVLNNGDDDVSRLVDKEGGKFDTITVERPLELVTADGNPDGLVDTVDTLVLGKTLLLPSALPLSSANVTFIDPSFDPLDSLNGSVDSFNIPLDLLNGSVNSLNVPFDLLNGSIKLAVVGIGVVEKFTPETDVD